MYADCESPQLTIDTSEGGFWLGDDLPQLVVNICENGLWFCGDSVHIFMEAFKKIAQKLLSILLTVAHEARSKALDL
jgi:hypothetical protein